MHCPTCGTQAPIAQKYCKSCGMDLQTVSATVADHLSTMDAVERPKKADTVMSGPAREAAMARVLIKAIVPGLIVIFIGMV
jgi:hypothetical protein